MLEMSPIFSLPDSKQLRACPLPDTGKTIGDEQSVHTLRLMILLYSGPLIDNSKCMLFLLGLRSRAGQLIR
jgi:hypothetical protein